jgi:muramidase (phage lysozyme)
MSFGAALSGFADGFRSGEGIKADRRRDEILDRVMQRTMDDSYSRIGDEDGYYAPDRWRSTPTPSEGGGGGSRMTVADPVVADMPGYQRAFLNAIALGESGGAYNVRYTPRGGQTFEETGDHPRIFEKGPHGPSSAAGRYQFTATTWDDMGGGAFTRENQDRKAWELAVRDYKARTGRNLDQDLAKDGLTPQITKALAPTWAAFNSAPDRYINEYQNSYTRYRDAGRQNNPTPHRVPLSDGGGSVVQFPSLAETAGRTPKKTEDPLLASIFNRMKGAS